jgi:hypothetical protein
MTIININTKVKYKYNNIHYSMLLHMYALLNKVNLIKDNSYFHNYII